MWPFLTILALLAAGGIFLQHRRSRAASARELAALRTAEQELRTEHGRELETQRARQQALFDSMTEGVLVLEASGRIQLVNDALTRLFDVRGDPRGRTVLEALRRHEVRDLAARVTREGRLDDGELTSPDATTARALEVSGALIPGAAGGDPGVLLVFRDVTRLKQLENTRREFVANVSHELRTPLSLIKGYVETLIDGAVADPAVSGRFLRTIEHHANRLAYLIEDLLTLSRLESGQLIVHPQPTDLRAVAGAVIEDLSTRATARRIILVNEVPSGTWVEAEADRLEQALFNLTDNAIKYGREGGRVAIGAQPAAAGWLDVWVQDDGPGIPAEAQARVFERFFRVDKARSRDAGGTGLGLAIVKHIVQAHGGEVRVESVEGRGATFHFTLRAVAPSPREETDLEPRPGALNSGESETQNEKQKP